MVTRLIMVIILKCIEISNHCYVTGTNILFVIGQLHFKNKLTEKEIMFVVTRAGEWREGDWMKLVVKRYKIPVTR